MRETPQRKYRQRTRWNVRDADATLIVTLAKALTGGSLVTYEYAKAIAKPCLHVFPGEEWPERLKTFLQTNAVKILNVAGPRSSSAPGIEQFVHEVLEEAHRRST
jgi:hypothetical protein